jgi:Domain of unknown function (DU1801)
VAELKTKQTNQSVDKFLKSIEDETRRKDCFAVAKLMEEVTGVKPKMWGPSIVGFDSYHYKYASGREGDMPIAAFSPRKQNLTLYIMPGLFDSHDELMKKLGKHTVAKSCLYIKRLDDIHLPTLKKLVSESVKYVKKKYK